MRRQRTRTLNRSCVGKLRHADRNAALAAIRALTAAGSVRLVVYPCHFCSKWHVGHYRPR